MNKFTTAVIGIALSVTTATADEIKIPHYDTPAYCNLFISNTPYSSCIKQENAARKFVMDIWNDVEYDTKFNCLLTSSYNFALAICLTGKTRNQSLWGKIPPTVQ